MRLKVSSAKWRPFCLDPNELMQWYITCVVAKTDMMAMVIDDVHFKMMFTSASRSEVSRVVVGLKYAN